MAMTDEQRRRAVEALRDTMKGPCPVCGQHEFTVADIVNALPYEPQGGLVLRGTTIPLLLVVCQSCKHVLPFAAVPLGVLGQDAPAKDPGEEAKP